MPPKSNKKLQGLMETANKQYNAHYGNDYGAYDKTSFASEPTGAADSYNDSSNDSPEGNKYERQGGSFTKDPILHSKSSGVKNWTNTAFRKPGRKDR
jgi:hypothetical protein